MAGRWIWATGAGFTAFAVAGVSDRVVASDVTEPMLRQTQRLGQERGIINLGLSQNAAEALPFADESIDLVTSRVSAHHFRDFEKALDEAQRVLKIGGSLLMADSVAPEDDGIAEWMNDIELRRDFSHVENRQISKIQGFLADRGFTVLENDYPRIYLRFNEWTARTKVSPEETAALRKDFLEAPAATREASRWPRSTTTSSSPGPAWVFRAVKG
jgi:SAM-dependent methyltransferase